MLWHLFAFTGCELISFFIPASSADIINLALFCLFFFSQCTWPTCRPRSGKISITSRKYKWVNRKTLDMVNPFVQTCSSLFAVGLCSAWIQKFTKRSFENLLVCNLYVGSALNKGRDLYLPLCKHLWIFLGHNDEECNCSCQQQQASSAV